jgi:hypothetical protein
MWTVESVSEETEEQLLTQIKCNHKFSLQVVKSTCYRLSLLLMFVRYCFQENVHENVILSVTSEDISWSDCWHLYEWSNSFEIIQQRLSSWSKSNLILTKTLGFSITWPSAKKYISLWTLAYLHCCTRKCRQSTNHFHCIWR